MNLEGIAVKTILASVLIVDDEPSIRGSLAGALSDEGITVATADSAETALEQISRATPNIVFLDIWMPGRDGLQILSEIKTLYPSLPVVVMSGHANISIAVKATQQGAIDFLEKPLDLAKVLALVQRAVKPQPVNTDIALSMPPERSKSLNLNKVVFDSNLLSAGKSVKQKTLASSVGITGQGLHTGEKSGVMLEPLPVDSGIHFVGLESDDVVPAHVDFVESTGYATTLRLGGTQVGTIEHLMSALNAYGITNLLIKCTGEIPVLDGSALEFCSLIEKAGIVEQDKSINYLALSETIRVGTDKEFIEASPSDDFIIDYTLKYPAPLGEQKRVFKVNDLQAYKTEIASARTFGFVKDIGWLQSQGLAQGGRFNNFVLFSETGPINCELRFKDEPVRHKILDAIGDLYLLGRPLQARITACMTGHSDNIALLQSLRTRLLSS
jgi:UDP-3-O-[3-hydroxymyristoyl] N-acetylglucosamine deacetylase